MLLISFSCLVYAGDGNIQPQAKLAIIIDDIGYNQRQGRLLATMPYPLTLAVLPFTPHGKELADLGHQQQKEIMLHAPMSNEQHLALGPGGLISGVTQDKLIQILDNNLQNIPHVKGVNNHMGSQLTQDAITMGWVMEYLNKRQLYFIDSRTTAKTQALNQAQAIGLPSRKRDVFLDNQTDTAHITQQLKLAIQYAKERGSAVAIGHPYPATVKVLKNAEALAEQQGVELVLVSALLSPVSLPKSDYQPGFCPAEPNPSQNKSIFVTEPFEKMRTP
jgi:uncharacterized protein